MALRADMAIRAALTAQAGDPGNGQPGRLLVFPAPS